MWDLHDLAGLPMTGCLYDKVVPSALELTDADEKGGRFIPRSSKYLLYAYHLLQDADDDRYSNMSIDKWVKFWSKKAIKYYLSPPCKEKKTVRPKSTHNRLGDITTHKRWSTAEEALFENLCIEGNLKEEVYLVAYLVCWLCTFVLPGKDVNSIHPITFKMASMMASGRRVSLAIPVLTSIYEGLNTITISSRPARMSPSFPVHFVYAWLTSYFKTHYPLEDEIQSIDASEESETSYSWTTTPPFGMGLKEKQLPQPPAVSLLEGESFLFSHHKEFLQKMWSDLLVKISNTLTSSHQLRMMFILESMKSFRKFDIMKKLSRSLHEQHLKVARARLQDVQAKASEGASKVQSIMDELEHVEKEFVALKGRRTSLCVFEGAKTTQP
ncbi:UNVERIFIED_CONTAM: hypothetical protein Slati_2407100 [Sesamum latifolium]|uniref:Aminotransferase-like plant mobile domain-containing protein n=1 Tax=Sesamum latifolium TaxID=2727402 RepID=A0AAW2WH20_9LAMI